MNTQQQALARALELCTGLSIRVEELGMDVLECLLTQHAIDRRIEDINAYIRLIASFIEAAQQKEMI